MAGPVCCSYPDCPLAAVDWPQPAGYSPPTCAKHSVLSASVYNSSKERLVTASERLLTDDYPKSAADNGRTRRGSGSVHFSADSRLPTGSANERRALAAVAETTEAGNGGCQNGSRCSVCNAPTRQASELLPRQKGGPYAITMGHHSHSHSHSGKAIAI